MLTIRKDQFAAFEKIATERFVQRLVPYLRNMWEAQCASLTDDQIAARASAGLTKATAWNLETELDIGRFIDLTFVFGPDFDRSEKCPWAAEILGDSEASASERMSKLWERARVALRDPEQCVDLSSRS